MQIAQSPAEFVAMQVRAVLESPGSASSWQSLADALPQYAVRQGADLESTLEAARLAGEMGASASSVGAGAPASAWETFMWSAASVADQVIPWVVAAVAVLVLLTLVRRAWSASRRVAVGRTTTAAAATGGAAAVPWEHAHALAAHGMPVHEISHRTGMSREAISTLLRVRR